MTQKGLPAYAVAALLSLLVVAAYGNSLRGGFVLDSSVIILDDTRLRSVSAENIDLIWHRSYWWPTTPSNLFRPFTTSSYLFNYSVLGNRENSLGYHLVNLLIHVVNVLLVWRLAVRLTRRREPAFLLAALWGLHPLSTEAVTNLVGRADLLAAFGTLAALYAWMHTGALAFIVAIATATIGIYSKESGVAVVPIVALYGALFDTRPWRRQLLRAAALCLPVAMFLYHRGQAIPASLPPEPFVDNPLAGAGFWQGRLTALAVVGRYLHLSVWPRHLSNDYSFAQIPFATGTWDEWLNWIVVALLTLLCGVVAYRVLLKGSGARGAELRLREERAFLLCAGLAAVSFLPASNLLFPTGTIMAERLLYLPLLGILGCGLIAIYSAASVFTMRPVVTPVLIGVLVLACGARTWARNRDWQSAVTLWSSAVRAAPASFKAHQGLADALYEQNPEGADFNRIIDESEQSVRILDRLPADLPASERESTSYAYRRAANYHLQRGDRLRTDSKDEAASRTDYERALQLATRHRDILAASIGANGPGTKELSDADLLLATVESKLGKGDAAIDAALRAQMAQPMNVATYQEIASAMLSADRRQEAVEWLLAGFTVTGEPLLRESVIAIYKSDPGSCALRVMPNGISLNPQCETVHRALCTSTPRAVQILRQTGRTDLADQLEKTVLPTYRCETLPPVGRR